MTITFSNQPSNQDPTSAQFWQGTASIKTLFDISYQKELKLLPLGLKGENKAELIDGINEDINEIWLEEDHYDMKIELVNLLQFLESNETIYICQ